MKLVNCKSYLRLGVACFTLSLSGCVSIPTSPTPRFYTLTPIDKNKAGVDHASARISGGTSDRHNIMIIGVGPVKIPEYLDRPQMVTKSKDKTLKFAQFDRWGESLDLGLASLIREDLTVMLPSVKLALYPWNPSMTVKYQVSVEVVQWDSELDGDMSLVVQWTVIDVENSKVVVMKRSEFHQPVMPQNYSGLAQTLSTACASLSHDIASTIGQIFVS